MGINTAVGSHPSFAGAIAAVAASAIRSGGACGISGCIVGVVICGWARPTCGNVGCRRQAESGEGVPPQSVVLGLAAVRDFRVCSVRARTWVLLSPPRWGSSATAGSVSRDFRVGKLDAGVLGRICGDASVVWRAADSKGTWRNNFGEGALHDLGLAACDGYLVVSRHDSLWHGRVLPGQAGHFGGMGDQYRSFIDRRKRARLFHRRMANRPQSSRRTLFAGLTVLILAMVCWQREIPWRRSSNLSGSTSHSRRQADTRLLFFARFSRLVDVEEFYSTVRRDCAQ